VLKIREIGIFNFGPYRGKQQLILGEKDGVTLVYGENMRGKTTLLNAIRFALIGKILGRGERTLEPYRLMNSSAYSEGEREFGVALLMENDGEKIEVRRRCTVGEEPDRKLKIDTTAFVADVPQSQAETNDLLQQLMPEEISRFFLFDGELLQQYEELLMEESVAGEQIREAIEQILGIPVLLNARQDLGEVIERFSKAETREAKKNQATEKHAKNLEAVVERVKELKKDRDKLKEQEQDLADKKAAMDNALKRSSKTQAHMAKLEQAEERIVAIDAKCDAHKEEIRDLMKVGWLWPAMSKLREMESEILVAMETEAQKKAAANRARLIGELAKEAVEVGKCPVCFQECECDGLSLGDGSENEDPDSEASDRQDEANRIRQLSAIKRLLNHPDSGRAVTLMEEIMAIVAERAGLKQDIKDINLQLESEDVEELKQVQANYGPTNSALSECRRALKDNNRQIDEAQSSVNALRKRLRRASGSNQSEEMKRRELAEATRSIFEKSIGRFRDELRDRIEADASALFKKLTTEKQFSGLRINANYGLEIMRDDGGVQELRSSGAEHIVALSLVGALQRNSSLTGPLFIDSPFGRLDAEHRKNVVKALPGMAPQVVLLVYSDELDLQMARTELGASLLAMHRLERRTATHTQIDAN